MPHRSLPKVARLPKLPPLLKEKLYKSKQTRGADDDEIYQNRVLRNGTILIFYSVWVRHYTLATAQMFENGYIVLLKPIEYFELLQNGAGLAAQGLTLGENALVFYETRSDWQTHSPMALNWTPAQRRTSSLGGQYVARIPGTIAKGADRIRHGFITSASKGAGIRDYEYADSETINDCHNQLEAIFWLCRDAQAVAVTHGMSEEGTRVRQTECFRRCEERHLLDLARLAGARILNSDSRTICPLCLEELSGQGFVTKVQQAFGREKLSQTITEINLFHIKELRVGEYNHVPYNVGWGHHHCNVVVKDDGIDFRLRWMRDVVERNIAAGYLTTENSGNGGS